VDSLFRRAVAGLLNGDGCRNWGIRCDPMGFHQFAFVGCALDDPPSDTEHARENVAGPVGAARETQWSEWFCAQSPGKSLACCGNLNNHALTPSSSSGGQRILFSCLHSPSSPALTREPSPRRGAAHGAPARNGSTLPRRPTGSCEFAARLTASLVTCSSRRSSTTLPIPERRARRSGGWRAVATEVRRHIGAIWTARSARTLAGTLRCGRQQVKT
jgi:hypothetical protein